MITVSCNERWNLWVVYVWNFPLNIFDHRWQWVSETEVKPWGQGRSTAFICRALVCEACFCYQLWTVLGWIVARFSQCFDHANIYSPAQSPDAGHFLVLWELHKVLGDTDYCPFPVPSTWQLVSHSRTLTPSSKAPFRALDGSEDGLSYLEILYNTCYILLTWAQLHGCHDWL